MTVSHCVKVVCIIPYNTTGIDSDEIFNSAVEQTMVNLSMGLSHLPEI